MVAGFGTKSVLGSSSVNSWYCRNEYTQQEIYDFSVNLAISSPVSSHITIILAKILTITLMGNDTCQPKSNSNGSSCR